MQFLSDVQLPKDPDAPLEAATQQYADGKVAQTGDTMTGNLTVLKATPTIYVDGSTTSGNPQFILRGLAATNRQIWAYTGANPRWLIRVASASAESGSDTGSDFQILAYDDAGTAYNAFTIKRDTRLITVAADPVSGFGVATKQYADAPAVTTGSMSTAANITYASGPYVRKRGGVVIVSFGLSITQVPVSGTQIGTVSAGFRPSSAIDSLFPIARADGTTTLAGLVSIDSTGLVKWRGSVFPVVGAQMYTTLTFLAEH